MAATLKDLATYTGYSVGTISNYINGKVAVSQAKQVRIEEAMAALQYQVNVAARTLKTQKHQTIGVLIPDMKNTFLVNTVSQMEPLFSEKQYDMLLLSYNRNPEKERRMLQYLAARTDGIIYVPMVHETPQESSNFIQRIQQHTPIVTFNEWNESIDCDTILVNNAAIVQEAMEALFLRGHREVGILLGPQNAYTSRLRKQGYCAAHEKRHWQVNHTLIASGDYSKTSGSLLCEQLVAANPNMTAIFVAGYRMTLGVIAALQKNGLSHKIAVIGYDAMDIVDVVNPPIAFVHQPNDAIARHAVQMVVQRIQQDGQAPAQHVWIEASLQHIAQLPSVAVAP